MVFQLLYQLFLLGLLLPAGAQPTAVQELYVKPTEDTSCTEPCHTLDEYVQNATQYFVSSTVFKFLPGTHNLSQSLTVSGVSNLTMVGTSGSVDIKCTESNYQAFLFIEISNLTLEDLKLFHCGLNLTNLLNVNLLRVCTESLPNDSVSLSAENIVGTSTFMELCMINETYTAELLITLTYNNRLSCWSPPSGSQLTIKDSDISLSFVRIEVRLYQSNYSVSLSFHNLKFYKGGSMLIITGSVVSNYITMGTLQFIEEGEIVVLDDTSVSTTSVQIENCTLLGSIVIILNVTSTQATIENSILGTGNSPHETPLFVTGLRQISVIRNVTFSDISTLGSVFVVDNATNLSFIDCTFLNNGRRLTGGKSSAQRSAVIVLLNSGDISFTDCEFTNNLGTPIAAVNSQYTLSASNTFINNSAYEGGAMAFYGQSFVTFTDGLDIQYVNNSAVTVGGAIYVDGLPDYYQLLPSYFPAQCFFKLQGRLDNWNCRVPVNLTLTFFGNNAGNGGNRVYGASLDTCILYNCLQSDWTCANPWLYFGANSTSDPSAITSDPLRVCLCENGRPSCTAVFIDCSHYPGETFYLSAVVVGDRFGIVDGLVYAQLLPVSGQVAMLCNLERIQFVDHQCTDLPYTVFTNSSVVTLALTTTDVLIQQYPSTLDIETDIKQYETNGQINSTLWQTSVYVNITLLPCPLGFVLSGEPPSCICDPQLQKNHISCDFSTQTFQRSGTEWINASYHGNSPSGVIVSKYCPNNYCKSKTVNVSLEDPDTQCAFHHSGILCGGCQSGLSLALGSAQCLHCSNAYLALLIPFALAGFVLMFFIKLLNLNVAVGSLNGLIFYANIVQANQVVWNLAETSILRVFIAWLNLDLGIETCFFDGLDAYWKTWLQFVFPLYIWAIVVLIIILSHYFSTAAKIFGNNSVPTLATLFLLSYPKLLRTIISIFQFSTLKYPDGTSETVWSYDGNIPYFSPEHIALFLMGVIVILFLWLPYTGTLIYAQCLQRLSNKTVGKIFPKLKPFFDTYFGPLKDKHRYWVGLLLLLRGILFIVFAATPTKFSEVNLKVTLAAAVGIMVYLLHVGSVYKHIYLSLLEISFFLNLAALAGGTLLAGKSQSRARHSALLSTSLSFAFIEFVTIISIHCIIICLKRSGLGHRLRHLLTPGKPQATCRDRDDDGLENESVVDRGAVQQLVISYGDYREPILKYLDSPL